mmetsp:Transcript_25665/g.59140  ORF Transcript_25665/g.59140 Transcript_25665/m.59140 type:complete len:269 (+) Transcript_25665:134-940(+)
MHLFLKSNRLEDSHGCRILTNIAMEQFVAAVNCAAGSTQWLFLDIAYKDQKGLTNRTKLRSRLLLQTVKGVTDFLAPKIALFRQFESKLNRQLLSRTDRFGLPSADRFLLGIFAAQLGGWPIFLFLAPPFIELAPFFLCLSGNASQLFGFSSCAKCHRFLFSFPLSLCFSLLSHQFQPPLFFDKLALLLQTLEFGTKLLSQGCGGLAQSKKPSTQREHVRRGLRAKGALVWIWLFCLLLQLWDLRLPACQAVGQLGKHLSLHGNFVRV